MQNEHNNPCPTIGEQMRLARKAAGVTQKQIATALDITVQAVNQWERNLTNPSLQNLHAMERFLGYSFDFGNKAGIAPIANRHVENVARALCAAKGLDPDAPIWTTFEAAALEAMARK